jgi:PAS domain S-box-containing protein
MPLPHTPIDEDSNNVLYSGDLAFLSRTAAELFDLSLEQDIYEVIGTRLKEMVGEAFVIINEYDDNTRLFRTRALKGLGGFAGTVVKLLNRNPEDMAVVLDDPEALEVLLTGKMARGPAGLYELSFKTIPRLVCQTIEALLHIGTIYVMGFARQGELLGDAVIICRRGENETRVAQQTLFIETFINQAALALHRKQAEEDLRKSEETHRKFIEHAPFGMYTTNLKGEFTYLNKKLENLTGYKREAWLHKPYHSLVHPDDLDFVQEKIRRRLNGKTGTDSYEIRIFNAKNEIRWIRISSESIFEDTKEGKKLAGMQAFVEDVTKIRRSEDITRTLFAISNAVTATNNLADLYQQIHQLLGKVFDVTNFFIVIVDTKKHTLHFPYCVDTMDKDFSSIDNFDENGSLSGLVVSRQKPILLKKKELEQRAAQNGVWGPVPLIWMGVPLMIRDEVIGVIAVQSYTDAGLYDEQDLQVLASVSGQVAIAIERKQVEEALRKSEALFKLITENTSALVSIHDSNGDYLFASPSHEQLGFRPEELIGKSGFAMMEEEDIGPLLAHLEKARKNEISAAFLDYRLRDKNGGIHYFRGSFDAVTRPDGSLERIVCVGEDITELRQAQAEKVEALALAAETEKLALVGQIAGKMAHDFNNILGVVMGNAELALMDCPHENTRKTLELIFEQTLRGKNLTKNLVAFARDQEPRQEFFRMDEKMELVMALLKKDLEGIRLIREYGSGIPEILADPGMVEHAVVNLIQNSIHAVSLAEHPEIIVRTYYQEECVILEIEDNGCGIPSGSLKEIFEPSFTLKGSKDTAGMYKTGIKGTGYGMSNVKKYVDQHKGRISVHSELKKGTRVAVSLPVIKKDLTDEEIQEIKKENICCRKYILLVEDEQAISDIQRRILTQEPLHHRVDIAAGAQAAVDLVNMNPYDLISLDYILPGELTGMDVYHHIRSKNKTVPVLFISGNIEFLESIKDLKQRDPYMDHLSKPCKHMDYIGSIHKLLAGFPA